MTIKDIAKISGVSVSTVSRVMNNHPDVSEENRKIVQSVIDQYRYVPNNSARDLVKTKSDSIGVVVRGVGNPFYSLVLDAIEKEISNKGYTMVMRQIKSDDDEINCAAQMEREKRLLGIIFLGGRFNYSKEDLKSITVPFVCCSFTNRYGSLEPNEYSSVSIEDEKEAYKAVRYLLEQGHRKVAVLISEKDDSSISQLRYMGYLKALEEAEIAYKETRILCADSFDISGAYKVTKESVKNGLDFTAMFAISDNMAIGAMRALHEAGFKVPEDCSVIGIDGLEISDYVTPRLTTLNQPKKELGSLSVDILTDILSGKGGNRNIILDTVIREGESVRKINM